jgi:hypothetical protein
MSRLSFHIHDISKCGQWLLTITRRSGLRWIKHIAYNADDPHYGDTIRVIARPWVGGDGVEAQYIAQGAEGADRYWADNGVFIGALATWAYAIEGPNEPYTGTSEARLNLSAYTRRLGAIYYRHDIRLVSGNISVGNPPLETEAIAELAPVLYPINFLGLHHYGRPTLANADPYELWRYRYLFDAMGDKVPTLLTEYGVDGTGTPMGQNGWRKAYRRFGDYLADLMVCDQQLEADGITCAFLFDVGGGKQWQSFGHERAEVEAILKALGLL